MATDDECEVLEAIYPDYVSVTGPASLTLSVPVDLDDAVTVHVVDPGAAPDDPPRPGLRLAQLPPLVVQLTLPPGYPDHAPPEIVALTATAGWMPDTGPAREQLLAMWSAGDGVLSAWVDAILTADLLRALHWYSGSTALRIPHSAPHTLAPALLAHAHAHTAATFAHASFACAICLTDLKGARCLRLVPCAHVFCRPCLTDFWALCIAEGDVTRVACPDPACVAHPTDADEDMVRELMDPAAVDRWRWLKAKRAVDRDPTIVHCPTPRCQAPVPKPALSAKDADSGWNRLRTCPACSLSFCAFCKKTWHGPITPCLASSAADILAAYLALAPADPERLRLERRHGAKWLRHQARVMDEERATQDFIDASTAQCPRCRVHVQKSFGCNHMTCAKCTEHFCYLCSHRLPADRPYAHFNDPNSPCYLKLFDALSQTEHENLLDVALRDMEM